VVAAVGASIATVIGQQFQTTVEEPGAHER
jgi:hypothetical protein